METTLMQETENFVNYCMVMANVKDKSCERSEPRPLRWTSPADWRGTYIEANIFSRVGPRATVLRSTDRGRAQTAVGSCVEPVLFDAIDVGNAFLAVRKSFLWPSAPLGGSTLRLVERKRLQLYMSISGQYPNIGSDQAIILKYN